MKTKDNEKGLKHEKPKIISMTSISTIDFLLLASWQIRVNDITQNIIMEDTNEMIFFNPYHVELKLYKVENNGILRILFYCLNYIYTK